MPTLTMATQSLTLQTMEWYPSDSSGACVRRNAADYPYEEFSCLYPSYGATYFNFETTADPVFIRDKMLRQPLVPIIACMLYGIFIVTGKAYFKNRDPLNLRGLMALWNLCLSLFSFFGMIRVMPALFHNLTHYSWRENLCLDPESHFGSGSTGFWVQLFILSKFPELIDTFFIVIHKKPLIFLHWYHHISVLLYCWHSYVTKAPAGIVFCAMNYTVHAIMYGYYFLMATRMKPKWLNPQIITIAQISQMVVGVVVTIAGWYITLFEKIENCSLHRENNMAALVMYGSYLFLFLQFFFQRYNKSAKGKQKKH